MQEPELEEEVEPGFSPSPDSEPECGDDADEPDQFFLQEEEELELEEGIEVVSGQEKQRRLSFMGFEAAEILTGLKTGPLVDLSDSESEEDIPIGQLRSDYSNERLPLQSRISKEANKAPRKPAASKPSSKKPASNQGNSVEKPDAPVPKRPAVQQGVKGGKKKSKRLMTRDELRKQEAANGWEPIGPDDEPPFHPPVFTGPPSGPVRPPDQSEEFTELQAFRLFFTDEMLDLVVEQTNKYARQRGADLRRSGHRKV